MIGDVYALAYRNILKYGIIKTLKINSTGDIIPIDERVYPITQLIYEPSLIKVSENVFALAYMDRTMMDMLQLLTSHRMVSLINK